jgi:hypothetical protein
MDEEERAYRHWRGAQEPAQAWRSQQWEQARARARAAFCMDAGPPLIVIIGPGRGEARRFDHTMVVEAHIDASPSLWHHFVSS